jgi:hypothetical protein
MNLINKVVLDLEIQDLIIQQSDWDHTENIRVSCCCLYSYLEDRYHVYGPRDLDYLRAYLTTVDLIIGYNINKFDLPVIYGTENRKMPAGLNTTYDILVEIWKVLGLDPTEFTDIHKGFSLNQVAKYTLNKQKTGSGAHAPQLWQQGNFWKVIDYCLNDVALTKDLYDFIQACGCVYNKRKGVNETVILNKEIYALWKMNQQDMYVQS